METLKRFEPIALLVMFVGALNWGILGITDGETNVLSEIFGTGINGTLQPLYLPGTVFLLVVAIMLVFALLYIGLARGLLARRRSRMLGVTMTASNPFHAGPLLGMSPAGT